MSAKSALALRLRPLEFSGDPFTVIHAWSARAASLAALAAPHRPRFATLFEGPDNSRDIRVFVGIMNRVPTNLLVACEQMRDRWSARGVPSMSMSVAPPGAVCEWLDPEVRRAVRLEWNEGENPSDEMFVVGILADHPSNADARLAIEIVGRLALGGRDVRLIIHPRSAHRADAERAARRIGLEHILIQDPAMAEHWRVLPGLDAALAMAGASQLSTLWACAAGVTCAVEQSDWVDDLLEDLGTSESGLVLPEFARGHVNAATAMLSRWCDDAADRRAAGEMSARLIHRQFEFQAFVDRFEHECDGALNKRGLRRVAAVSAGV